jgi:uroporphyrinogen decarboxylase
MAALAGERADRPPFDFWAEDATLNRLFKYLGHDDLERFLDDMKIDIRSFNAVGPENKELGNGVFENMWGERFIFRETGWGPMREDTCGALYFADSFEELKSFSWPSNDMLDYSRLGGQCREARDKGLAVRYGFGDIWQRPALVRGFENHLADMATNPGWVHYLSELFTNFYIEDYRRAWEASGGEIDIFLVVSDLGTQRGPLISVCMFEQFIAPYLVKIGEVIHSLGAKFMFHSCGDVESFIPSMIKCGVDILNPLQPAGDKMKPETLKKYSGKICFHGGMDVQQLIPFGTSREIKAEAKRYADTFGSGYILCPAHLFQPDTPPENIVALYEAFD